MRYLRGFFLSSVLLATPVYVAAESAQPTNTLEMSKVPLKMEEIYGQRPVVRVVLNSHPFDMVIHSNASFFMQMSHAEAKVAGIDGLRHAGEYGIDKPGHVSSLGLDDGQLANFLVGATHDTNVSVSVFETPGDQGTGMLGIKWIRRNRLVIDYPTRTATLNPTPKYSEDLQKKLLASGYAAIQMTFDTSINRYTVPVTMGDVTKAMTVSTVAHLNLDTQFASEAGVKAGKDAGEYGGPSGAVGVDYTSTKPVILMLGEWRSAPISDAHIKDTYAYMKAARPPSNASGGELGADFMAQNAAVIDFGSNVLYLRNITAVSSAPVGRQGKMKVDRHP